MHRPRTETTEILVVSVIAFSLLGASCTRSQPSHPHDRLSTPASTRVDPHTPDGAASLPATETVSALTVSAPAREGLVAVGEIAPGFTATAHNGQVVHVGGARARVLVIYFYPRDETPGCTREAQSFRDDYGAIQSAGADLVGVSTDGALSHRQFAEHHGLQFGLIADRDGALSRAYGVEVSARGTAHRTTFVISRDGRIARVFADVRVEGHSGEVLAAVRELTR